MDTNKDLTRWKLLQRLGILGNVETEEQYNEITGAGLLEAKRFLYKKKVLFPSPSELRLSHLLAYGHVHGWAGQFRTSNDEAWVSGLPCTPPEYVEGAIIDLNNEMQRFLAQNDGLLTYEDMAYYHSRFQVISPFRAGTEELGRRILAAQLDLTTQKEELRIVDAREYKKAMDSADLLGNVAPLAQVIRDALPVKVELPTSQHEHNVSSAEKKLEAQNKLKLVLSF